MTENIFPIKDIMESRTDKEAVLGQKGVTIWFTGLSGSGKSTVAIALESLLSSKGYLCRILDGDLIPISAFQRLTAMRISAGLPRSANSSRRLALSQSPLLCHLPMISAGWRGILSEKMILSRFICPLRLKNASDVM